MDVRGSWNALFQGRPTSAEGNILKREWWQYYEELPEIIDWIMSVDATFKDGDDNDFVAIQVWGKTGADMYFIDAVKRHLNMPDTVREILRLRAMYPKCLTTLVEDKANGSAIIQVLRHDIAGIIPITPEGGKIAVSMRFPAPLNLEMCIFQRINPLRDDFVEGMCGFSTGRTR